MSCRTEGLGTRVPNFQRRSLALYCFFQSRVFMRTTQRGRCRRCGMYTIQYATVTFLPILRKGSRRYSIAWKDESQHSGSPRGLLESICRSCRPDCTIGWYRYENGGGKLRTQIDRDSGFDRSFELRIQRKMHPGLSAGNSRWEQYAHACGARSSARAVTYRHLSHNGAAPH